MYHCFCNMHESKVFATFIPRIPNHIIFIVHHNTNVRVPGLHPKVQNSQWWLEVNMTQFKVYCSKYSWGILHKGFLAAARLLSSKLNTKYPPVKYSTHFMSISICVTINARAPAHAISTNGLIRGSKSFDKPGTMWHKLQLNKNDTVVCLHSTYRLAQKFSGHILSRS